MPNIGFMHPYVVHIVVGFVIAGCVLRSLSLTGQWNWMNQAAATALIDATGALGDIDALLPAVEDAMIKRNATLVRAYAFLALGLKDSARAVVERLASENPANARYRALLDSLR